MTKAKDWQWWHSHNGGEEYYGPCDTREDAIAEGRDQADGESFIICEARKGGLRDFINGRVSEWLDDRNDDQGPPDEAISERITDAQWKDLDARLTEAAKQWADANNIHDRVWAFAATRNDEDIEGDDYAAHETEDAP